MVRLHRLGLIIPLRGLLRQSVFSHISLGQLSLSLPFAFSSTKANTGLWWERSYLPDCSPLQAAFHPLHFSGTRQTPGHRNRVSRGHRWCSQVFSSKLLPLGFRSGQHTPLTPMGVGRIKRRSTPSTLSEEILLAIPYSLHTSP